MDIFENNKPMDAHDGEPETVTPESPAETAPATASDAIPEIAPTTMPEDAPQSLPAISEDQNSEATDTAPTPTQETAEETAPEIRKPDEVFSAEACWAREAEYGDTFWHTTTPPDPVYRVERQETSSPYVDSPYVSYDEAEQNGTTEQWRASFEDAPPIRKPRKDRKNRKSGKAASRRLVAAALAFALVGSTLGAVITGAVMNRKLERTTAQLQSQIEALGNNRGGLTINTAGTPTSGTTAPTGGIMTPAQVYAQNVQSVVSVTTTGYTSNRWTTSQFTSTGSGFILSQDGYVLTNYHVIEGYSAVEISTTGGETYEASVVGFDAFSDVALLKVEAEGLPSVVIGDSDATSVGDMVAAIGNPLGELQSTQTVGYVSAKNRMVNTDGTTLNMLQTDAAINSGNSGGPLFNMYGQVIGITTAKYSGSSSSGATIEGIGFAIPINAVMALIEDLIEHGYITNQAYMGVKLDEMDPAIAQYYGFPTGPRVSSIEEGSAAQKAGIEIGDIIDAVGEVDITTHSDLAYALRSYQAGDTATITVFRSGEFLELTITFDEKPATTVTTEPIETQPENNGGYGFFPWP